MTERRVSSDLFVKFCALGNHGKAPQGLARDLINADAANAELQREVEGLRALMARAYKAALKPEWEEGECLNEVLTDLSWEGIDVPAMNKEAKAPATKDTQSEEA